MDVTDVERRAVTFTAYDLDVHLTPATSAISVRAGLTVRNDGPVPLTRLVLQISSSLQWQAVSTRAVGPGGSLVPLHFATQTVDTDADHTGFMDEAVVTLPGPLAPGEAIKLTAVYAGKIRQSAERLERIGAPTEEALFADWDSVSPFTGSGIALRGFGDVLWYPVSAPPVYLGDGNKLFQAIGDMKRRESSATVRLRLAIEYAGDPPDAAYFCGRAQHLVALTDNVDAPIAEAPGIATANFDAQPLGFRIPSLFIASHPATLVGGDLISGVTDNYDALEAYGRAASMVGALLTEWLGTAPLTPLTLLDHAGQPFEDDALLVRPVVVKSAPEIAPSLAHSLTHAWVHSNYAWIDEGLAQFMALLWTERTQSRAAAVAQLQDNLNALAIAEPPPAGAAPNLAGMAPSAETEQPLVQSGAQPGAISSSSSSAASSSAALGVTDELMPGSAQPSSTAASGQSLIAATTDIYYRTKASAVFWMLRGLVGEDVLKKALQAYRANPKADRDPQGFEQMLELSTQKDLHWFFDDWVYHDPGLPDLSIVNVTPRQMEGRGGRDAGWLVSVFVRNDGDAAADVPVTVRSIKTSETERLRIPGRSSASVRILFSSTPDEVVVNGGEVPEVRGSTHTVKLVLPAH